MSANKPFRLSSIVWLCPAVALLIALAPLPYGYYTLLRIIVCGAAALIAYQHYEKEREVSFWVALMAGVAILFNPIIPVHLNREIWAPIDIITAVIFFFHWRKKATVHD